MMANDAKNREGRTRSIGLGSLACLVILTALGTAWQELTSMARAETSSTTPRKAVKDETAVDPPRPPSPAQILQELMKKDRLRPAPIPPSTPGKATEKRPPPPTTTGPGPRRNDLPLKTDGSMITDRVGRLIRRPKGWFFAFESEGKVLREPPMQLLPNLDLETMEVRSANATKPVKFRVSGEVTVYRGTNYLLLRKVLVVHGMGNIK